MQYVPFMWSAPTDLDRPELKTSQYTVPTATPGTKTFIWSIEAATKYPTAMVRKAPDTICCGMIPVAYIPLFGDYYHGNNRSTVAVCAIYAYCMTLTLATIIQITTPDVYSMCFLQMLALPATVNGSGRIAMVVAILETIGQFLFVGFYGFIDSDFDVDSDIAYYTKLNFYILLSIQTVALLAIPLWELFSHFFGPGVGMFDSPVNGEVNAVKVFQYSMGAVRWRPPFRLSEWKAINKHNCDPSRLAYFSTARRWLNEIVMIPGLAIMNIDWAVPRISHNFHLPNPLPLLYYIAVSCAISTCVFIGIIFVPQLADTYHRNLGQMDPILISIAVTISILLPGHIVQYFVVKRRCRQVQQGLRQSPISATPYLAVNFIGSSIMGHLIAFTVLFFAILFLSTLPLLDSKILERFEWLLLKILSSLISAVVAQILLRVFMSRVVADQKDIKKPYLFSAAYLYIAMASTISMLMGLLQTLVIYVIILPISAMFPLFPLFSMLPRLDPAFTGLWAALSMHNTARNPLKITMIGYMLARAEIRSITRKAVLQFGLDRCVRMSGLDIIINHTDEGSLTINTSTLSNHQLPIPPNEEDAAHSPITDATLVDALLPRSSSPTPFTPLNGAASDFDVSVVDVYGTTSNNSPTNDYMLRLSDFGSSQRFLHLTHSIRLWVLFRAGFLRKDCCAGAIPIEDPSTPHHHHDSITKEVGVDGGGLMYDSPDGGGDSTSVAPWPKAWSLSDDFARENADTRLIASNALAKAVQTNHDDHRREKGERDEIRRRRADNSYRDSYYPLGMGCEEELREDGASDEDEAPRTFASLPGPAVSKRDIERSLTGLVRAIFSNARLLVPLRAILQTSEAKDMLSELQHRMTPTRPLPVPPGMSAVEYAALVARQQVSPYRRKLRVANRWLLALMLLRYPSIRPLRKHALRKTQYTPAVPMLRGVLESHCGQSGGCCCCCYCASCE